MDSMEFSVFIKHLLLMKKERCWNPRMATEVLFGLCPVDWNDFSQANIKNIHRIFMNVRNSKLVEIVDIVKKSKERVGQILQEYLYMKKLLARLLPRLLPRLLRQVLCQLVGPIEWWNLKKRPDFLTMHRFKNLLKRWQNWTNCGSNCFPNPLILQTWLQRLSFIS